MGDPLKMKCKCFRQPRQLCEAHPLVSDQWLLHLAPPQPAQGIGQDRAPVLLILFALPTHEPGVITDEPAMRQVEMDCLH